MELCPLKELRRLSTEPPALSLGLSTCSLSGWETGGEPGIPSRLESCNEVQQSYGSSMSEYFNQYFTSIFPQDYNFQIYLLGSLLFYFKSVPNKNIKHINIFIV